MSKEQIFDDSFTFSKIKGVAVNNDKIFASEDNSIFTYSDCNNDNTINILDFIALEKMTTQDEQSMSADLNQDGNINSNDLTVMKKILLGVFTSNDSVSVLNVSDFGAVGDGVTDDSAAITNAVKALKYSKDNTVLNFEANKTYFVSSETTGETIALNLQNEKNKTINGNNSTIILDRDMYYMNMRDCENLSVVGFNFDLKERSHFVGTVTDKKDALLDSGDHYIEVASDRDFGLEGDYVPTHSTFFGFVSTGEKTSREYLYISKIETIDSEALTYRIYLNNLNGTFSNLSDLANGDQVILPVPGIAHTDKRVLDVQANKDIVFQNINVWGSRDFVWVVGGNKGTVTFDNVNVTPPEDETVCFSSWRDTFHCKANTTAIIWKNCTFKGSGDDIFNLSSNMLHVEEVVSENEVICVWDETNGSYAAAAAGLPVVIWDVDTGKLIGRTTVKEVVDLKTNRYILSDSLPNLTAGDNIRFCFDTHCAPNSQIINCELDGTFRFHGGPVTVSDSNIRLIRLYIDFHNNVEGPLPNNITFSKCAFNVDSTVSSSIKPFVITCYNPNDVWKEGDYRLENISFVNCTGLKKSYFNSNNFDENSPDYITFSPALAN